MKMRKGSGMVNIIMAILGILTTLIVIGIGHMFVVKIGPGYAGVVYNMNGGVESIVLRQGWHFISPTKSVIEYPIATETVYLTKDTREGSPNDDSFDVNTRDGKPVNVDVTYAYHFSPETLPETYTKFKGSTPQEIQDGIMKNALKEVTNNVSSTFGVMDIYGNKRSELNFAVFSAFRDKLKSYGIIIETFNFSRIAPDAKTLEAIQRVVDEQNKVEQDKIEKEREKIRAEKKRIEAEGEAAKIRIAASAEADRKRMEADSIEYYNTKVRESLNSNIVALKWIERWNGVLSQFSMDGKSNMPMIFNAAQGSQPVPATK